MPPLRIGSLFTGTGALDLAVMDVFDAEVVWHSQYEPPDKDGKEDKNQYAAKILARHWPATPNLGDITKVDWPSVLDEHGPIDVVTGGFPCTDVSSAGKRAGLTPETRSGLWNHMARCIAVLRPRLVVIENVEGLLSAEADRGVESGAEAVDAGSGAGGVLRALGAVLGDLATLGFHAEWARVAASEVGAPHPRKRVFVYAWPAVADADGGESERGGVCGVLGGPPAEESRKGDQRERAGDAARDRSEVVADTADVGHERGRSARGRGDGSPHGCVIAADTSRHTWGCGHGDGVQPGWRENGSGPSAGRGSAAHAVGIIREHDGQLPPGRDTVRGGVREDAPRCGAASADADDRGRRADVLQLRPGQPDLDWGDYEPAIRRWEHILGRPAPWPTDTLGRLTPVFTEWMMGLPDGWVTCTPGLTKNAMAKALGNGVVPQQAAAAIRLLHQRAIDASAAADMVAA